MKKDTLKLFVLTIMDYMVVEVHLFNRWSAVVNYVAERTHTDFDAVKKSLDARNQWIDESKSISYTVTIQGIED